MYRNFDELTKDERDELRSTLFFQQYDSGSGNDYDYLSADDKAIVDDALYPDVIPDDLLRRAFGGYSFVEGDFFCNLAFCDSTMRV